jgi:hypothetical protein
MAQDGFKAVDTPTLASGVEACSGRQNGATEAAEMKFPTAMKGFTGKDTINPLTLELNISAQRCLTRF